MAVFPLAVLNRETFGGTEVYQCPARQNSGFPVHEREFGRACCRHCRERIYSHDARSLYFSTAPFLIHEAEEPW